MEKYLIKTVLTLSLLAISYHSLAETIKPKEHENPICPTHSSIAKIANHWMCKPSESDATAIRGLDENACEKNKEYLEWKDSSCKWKGDIPAKCNPIHSYTAKITGNTDNAKCEYDRQDVLSSAAGDYIGDVFSLAAPIPNLDVSKKYITTYQENTSKDDPTLTLVEADRVLWIFSPWRAKSGAHTDTVQANTLIKSGAGRQGYVYGVLTMPYKYSPSLKKFSAGIPIGPYLGWRKGQSGSAVTYATALTLGTVQAEVLDDNNKISGTTSVAALSFAVGAIFDVLKTPTGKSFKSGIFVGVDRINNDPKIRYEFGSKPWIAIQIGYDFTDN